MAERKTLADKARLKERDRAREARELRAEKKVKLVTAGLIIAACVMIAGLGIAGYRMFQYRRSAEAYDRALKLAAIPTLDELVAYQTADNTGDLTGLPGLPGEDLPDMTDEELVIDSWAGLRSEPDEYADRLALMDLEALRAENPDVAGWIDIPDTDVSYPFVQCGDTTTYLRRAWDGTAASAGSIFMEPGCTADLKGFNTILYGHNMTNGTMFGVLKNYKKHDWWENHQNIYLTTSEGVFRYRVYSVRMASLSDTAFVYGDPTAGERENMLSSGLSLSEIYTGVQVGSNSRILTLSTCTGLGRYDVRLVVQAVLEWHRNY